MARRTGLGLAAALFGGIAFGSNAPFAAIASQLGVPGADAVFWRAIVMIAICVIWAMSRGHRLGVPPDQRLSLAGLGIATTVTSIAYLSAVAFVPVAVAAVIYYTYPVQIMLISPLVDGERVTLPRLLVFAVAFAGIILVLGLDAASLDARGMALAAMASAGGVGMFFFGNRVMNSVPPEVASTWVHFIVLPVAFLVSLSIGGPVSLPLSWPFATAFAVIVGSYIAGYLLQLVALTHIPAVTAGLVFLIEPVVAILVAAIVLHERLTLPQYAGCAIVLCALVACALVEQRELRRRVAAA